MFAEPTTLHDRLYDLLTDSDLEGMVISFRGDLHYIVGFGFVREGDRVPTEDAYDDLRRLFQATQNDARRRREPVLV